MDKKSEPQRGKKKKFKQTRQLVKLALNDGWTQKSIADSCRSQQSVVSSWARGEKQANEEQLKPLLEIYGNKIRRQFFKIYYNLNNETGFSFSKVEGKIIFSYTYTKAIKVEFRKSPKHISVKKIIVHEQGGGLFRTITQNRPSITNGQNQYLDCSVEEALWFSTISKSMNAKEIIEAIDGMSKDNSKDFYNESITLPFLIRKAMLDHGHSVDGIVHYPSIC